MSLAIVLVLAAVVALANAQCTVTLTKAVWNTPSAYNSLSAGGSDTATCLPGYVAKDYSDGVATGSGSTSFTVKCSSLSGVSYSSTSMTSATCVARNDWCPTTINANFGNTSAVTAVFSRSVDSTVRLICKPTGLGRNWRGNGTSILVTCASSADGSTGVWVSDDWCSGALGVSANVALLALAAVAGLFYKRFF